MRQQKIRWLLDASPLATPKDVLRWWQERRLVFNIVLLFIGFCSICIKLFIESMSIQQGSGVRGVLAYLIGVPLYALVANVVYTFAPYYDAKNFIGRPRVKFYTNGTIVWGVLTALPGVWAVVAFIITAITGKKL